MADRSSTGVYVTDDRVFGLVTVVQCIRIAAHMVAGLGPIIYDARHGEQNKVQATKSWQWKLFERPGEDTTKFNLFTDISASIDGYGNAYVQKLKATTGARRVLELAMIDPRRVRVYRDKKTGEKLFAVKNPSGRGETKDIGTDEILHIRGFSMGGSLEGLSLVQQFKVALGTVISVEDFAGRYFTNDATPGGYISLPSDSNIDKTQLDEILEIWEERHSGGSNKHRPAILQGGAKYEVPTISAESAQLLLARRYSVEELARMCDMPVDMVETTQSRVTSTEEIVDKTKVFHIMPRAERIKSAFNADPDLFYGSNIYIDVDYNKTRVANLESQGNFDMKMRQGGILTANEIRARQGYPPHPDGDELQMTPVGGGPNPGNGGDEPKPKPKKDDSSADE